MAWFQVAFHLKVPVEELKGRMTYSEFLEWKQFLRMEDERHTKLDYYLAQIACEIWRVQVTTPGRIALKDFLLRFMSVDKQEEIKKSKSTWFGALNIDESKLN